MPDLSDFVSSMFEIFAGVAGSILCSTSTDIASKVQQHCNMLDTFRWRGLLVPWIGWFHKSLHGKWVFHQTSTFELVVWGSRYFLDNLTWTKKVVGYLKRSSIIIFTLSVLGNSKHINSGKEWMALAPKYVRWTMDVHPGRLTWNLQSTHLERKMIFQASMIMFHVNLPECTFKTVLLRTTANNTLRPIFLSGFDPRKLSGRSVGIS